MNGNKWGGNSKRDKADGVTNQSVVLKRNKVNKRDSRDKGSKKGGLGEAARIRGESESWLKMR